MIKKIKEKIIEWKLKKAQHVNYYMISNLPKSERKIAQRMIRGKHGCPNGCGKHVICSSKQEEIYKCLQCDKTFTKDIIQDFSLKELK